MRSSFASQSASLVHTSRPSERHTHGRLARRTGSLVCPTIQSSICRPAVGARPHITALELVCIDRWPLVRHADPVRPRRQNEAGEIVGEVSHADLGSGAGDANCADKQTHPGSRSGWTPAWQYCAARAPGVPSGGGRSLPERARMTVAGGRARGGGVDFGRWG